MLRGFHYYFDTHASEREHGGECACSLHAIDCRECGRKDIGMYAFCRLEHAYCTDCTLNPQRSRYDD